MGILILFELLHHFSNVNLTKPKKHGIICIYYQKEFDIMAPISAAALQKDLVKYLDKTIKENNVLKVSTQYGTVAIVNTVEYEKQLQLLEQLETEQGILRGKADILSGRVHTHEEVFGRLDTLISQMQGN